MQKVDGLTLRLETPGDHRAVEVLTREAFMAPGSPGYDYEHYLVHLMRGRPSFVPELDIVAEAGGRLVGHVLYSRARVVEADHKEHEVLTFGPVSVRPEAQGMGVGRALLEYTFALARGMGHRAVVIYGHPDYYPRLGFARAAQYGITAPGGASFDALMALPLYDGALAGVAGVFEEDPAFHTDVEAAAEYDKSFPRGRQPARTPITALLDELPPAARQACEEANLKWLSDLTRVSGEEMARWPGMDAGAKRAVNAVMERCGYPKKAWAWEGITPVYGE